MSSRQWHRSSSFKDDFFKSQQLVFSLQFRFESFSPTTATDPIDFSVPAHFRIKNVNQSGIAGQSVVLPCEAEGETPIGITWNSSPNLKPFIKETPNSVISELHLDYLNRRHAGIYRCTATNRFGQDYMAIHLSVKGGYLRQFQCTVDICIILTYFRSTEPPESPQNIEVIEAGSRWLKFNWTSPYNDNIYYIVQYRSLHENIWSNLTMPNAAQIGQIETLVPNTVYLVRVIAFNEVGRSKPSIDITARTTQEGKK